MTKSLTGILPAVITPTGPDSAFAPEAFEQLLHHLYQAGVQGVYVCGQTGEGHSQSVHQRKAVAEAAVRFSPPDKLVIVQVGAHATADAVELARHAAAAGVHAVSSLPPLGPYSFHEIRQYYETLAAATDLPLFVYHHPDLSPQLNPELVLQLCTIPRVAGLKYTDYDLYGLSTLRHSGALVFNGRDEVLAAGLLMGATGGIGAFYNIFPETFVRIYALTREGRWAEAASLQRALNIVLRIIFRYPLVPAIRTVLARVGIACGEAIEPRGRLTASEKDQLWASVQKGCAETGIPVAGMEVHTNPSAVLGNVPSDGILAPHTAETGKR
ncbi:MAG: dihydrodipicolinate synthase family protein [Bryobacteraceae bacterium]